jgi:hypothetical protein
MNIKQMIRKLNKLAKESDLKEFTELWVNIGGSRLRLVEKIELGMIASKESGEFNVIVIEMDDDIVIRDEGE